MFSQGEHAAQMVSFANATKDVMKEYHGRL